MLDTAPDAGTPGTGEGRRAAHRSVRPGQELRERVDVLRRHWLVALLTFVVVLTVAVGSLLVTGPVYRAQADVLLRTQDSQQLFPRTSGNTDGVLARTPGAEIAYIAGDEFQQLAEQAAGSDQEVAVRNDLGSDVLVFTAEDDDAEAAAATAQTWAETYVDRRHELDVAEATRLRDLLVADREAADARRRELLQPVTALDAVIAGEADPGELSLLLNQRLAVERSLAGELDPLEAEIRRMDGQIAALDLDLRVLQDPQALAAVTRAAEVPESRVDGSLTRNLVVGVLAGLVLAAGAVRLAERVRRS